MTEVLAEWRERHRCLHDEARRGRLERRLIRAGVQRVSTQGGGDCQFYAFCDALRRSEAGREVSVDRLRDQAATWLEIHVDDDDIAPMRVAFLDTENGEGREDSNAEAQRDKFLKECERLRRVGGKWGDEFSLRALSNVQKVRVHVISGNLSATPDGDGDGVVTIDPAEGGATIAVTLALSAV